MKKAAGSKQSFIAEMSTLRESLRAIGQSPVMDEISRMIEIIRREVGEQRRIEDSLKAREEIYRTLVDSTDDSIYLVDRSGCYLFINAQHLRRMGVSEEAAVGKPYAAFHASHETKEFMLHMRKVFRTGKSQQFEHRSDRDRTYFLRTMSPVKDQRGGIRAVTVISKDITVLKTMEERLKALSLADDLTGLYNRRGFKTVAEQQLRIARRLKQPVLLLYADVDDLKRINDSRGHAAGDRTLKQVAAILRKCFRDSDIVARIGGDEFVALIVDATEQDPQRYRERLDRQCGRLNARTKGQQPLSMSIGTFRCDPDASCTIEDLLDRADRSMYRHKSKRRIAQR